MATYTVHDKFGGFTQNSFRSLALAVKCAVGLGRGYFVAEEYLAPSPWGATEITKHGRNIFTVFR